MKRTLESKPVTAAMKVPGLAVGAALAAAVLCGCVPNTATRRIADRPCPTGDGSPAATAACSRHAAERGDRYTLAVVEFTDQGNLHDEAQARLLTETLRREALEGPLNVVVYAHGWKHDAAAADADFVRFRRTLVELAELYPARRPFGLYLGWHGRSFDPPWPSPSKQLTFWGRKAAAHNVAGGALLDVLAEVESVRDARNRDAGDPSRVRLVTVGHSFGGLIVFEATKALFFKRLNVARHEDDGKLASGYGDLVVLINPASEGVDYMPLVEKLDDYGENDFNLCQRPVLVTLTAGNDWATEILFPVGRWLSTLTARSADRDEWELIRNTPGHVDRMITHNLYLEEAAPSNGGPVTPEEPAVDGLGGGTDLARQVDKNALYWFNSNNRLDNGRLKAGWRRRFHDGVVLEHRATNGAVKYDPHNPVWNVAVDPTIINGHNEIWGEDFRLFLLQLHNDQFRYVAACEEHRAIREAAKRQGGA